MSGWLNLNESLNSLKGQITTFARDVLAEDEDSEDPVKENVDWQKLCIQKDQEIERLTNILKSSDKAQTNGEDNWNWPDQDTPDATLKQALENALKEKNDLLHQLELLDSEHQQNIAQLLTMRDQLQEENLDLKRTIQKHDQPELAVLRSTHETLAKTLDNFKKSSDKELGELVQKLQKSEADNKRLISELESANELIKAAEQKSLQDIDNCRELDSILQSYDKQVKFLKQQLEEQHNNYVRIVSDNVQKYLNPGSEQAASAVPDQPQLEVFTKHVEDIFKLLSDTRVKVDHLEQQLLESTKESSSKLQEKNQEIESLLQHSEQLSLELGKKSDTIKDLESEVTSLINSNDILLSELDAHKNPALQTISESNEDSMVILEDNLEKANNRIKELEDIIDSPTKTTPVPPGEVRDDYQMLLNSFDNLKLDYDQAQLQNSELESDNHELQTLLDKAKNDFENSEYQLSEANITIDGLKEEVANLEQIVKELKTHSMGSIDLKSELNDVKEMLLNEENLRRQFEVDIKSLTEKVQTLKVSETSLKLQLSTLNKEYILASETLVSMKTSLTEYESNYSELLQKYDELLLKCEELNAELHEKEQLLLQKSEENTRLKQTIVDLEHKVTQHKTDGEKYEALLVKCELLDSELQQKQQDVLRLTEDNGKLEKSIPSQEVEQLKNQYTDMLQLAEEEIEQLKGSIANLAADKEVEITKLQNQLQELTTSRNELINMVTIKDQENGRIQEALQSNQLREEVLIKEIEQLKHHQEHLLKSSNENVVQQQIEQSDKDVQITKLQNQLQELTTSRNELINMVTIKHQENVSYHAEIQRLTDLINHYQPLEVKLQSLTLDFAEKKQQLDKLTDENSFLKEKCDILANNLVELQKQQTGPTDKEMSLAKQLERLQNHLVELEENSTRDLLTAEQKNEELKAKLAELEQREKNSSTMYTSVSIRANQQVETLQSQLQLVTNQREELRKRISEQEDQNSRQAAALSNLQFVLEQFQKDREKDIQMETERIRRQLGNEKKIQDNLKKEIENLQAQLEESKIGLQAASRLSDQLEMQKKQNGGLRDEVTRLQTQLDKANQTIEDLSTDGKIDKNLIKSLFVGFLSSGQKNWNKDQNQVLKLIATVLDFNQQEHDKININKQPQGWLSSLLHPLSNGPHISQESLSQAFVRFLEAESRPRNVPSLLPEGVERSASSSRKVSPAPIVLNEVVLPTFADFGQSRNSSSILKDVLKDNNG